MKYITTSWDDGYELDMKLAGLLHKYNMKATFYIPKANAERRVMPSSDVKDLATNFEIGGHTVNHVRLHKCSKSSIEQEVGGCYRWLTELIGEPPVSFCFPGGVYNRQALEAVFNNGFKLARTTELHNIQIYNSSFPVPTTLQVYHHNYSTYLRHLIKRKRFKTLIRWMKSTSGTDLIKLTESYLKQIERTNGCFHLWGHSWEIEEYNLWNKLEELFKILSNRPGFSYLENRQLLNIDFN